MGKIAAGTPIEAIQQNDTSVDVPREMMPIGESYALTVEGDSMINEGIHNGDTVLIKKTNIADNGEIVVGKDDNEATLKELEKKVKVALGANPIMKHKIYLLISKNSGKINRSSKKILIIFFFNNMTNSLINT